MAETFDNYLRKRDQIGCLAAGGSADITGGLLIFPFLCFVDHGTVQSPYKGSLYKGMSRSLDIFCMLK